MGFLVVALQDGIAVVALLVWGDEVWVYLFLGFADLHAEGGDLLESAGFYADAVKLALLHLIYKNGINQKIMDYESSA
jgi:mannose/fructose/N-acetylgalactosamine-specific phosphotransferase system component IIC